MKGATLFRLVSASGRSVSRTKPIHSSKSPLIASYANSTSTSRFYSSESDPLSKSTPGQVDNQRNIPSVEGVDVVSDEELKRRIERFYDGDGDAIPSIFEAILTRKLAGVNDDENLMKELREKFPAEIDGKEGEDSEWEDLDDDDVMKKRMMIRAI
ncbi:hypothetical protein LINPERPRIM_LOCUS28474 [Linum perenne]